MALHKLELLSNFTIWTSAVLYAVFKFYNASIKLTNKPDSFEEGELSTGWSLLGRPKDTSDQEWDVYLVYFQRLTFIIVAKLLFTALLERQGLQRYKPHLDIAFTIGFLLKCFNITSFLVIICQPLMFHLFGRMRSRKIVWLCSLFNLHIITILKHLSYDNDDHEFLTVEEQYITVTCLFWINLRCTSYYLDIAAKSYEHSEIEMLAYSLYLPTLFTGPFIPYQDFRMYQDKRALPEKLVTLLVKFVRFTFWLGFIELTLHFIYVNAMYFQIEIVEKFDSLTLYGYGYCMGQFFHMKYVVLYGFSTAAAEFEGVAIPPTPRCIGRVHLYSDMWKHFDRGLYTFLIRYIYIPLLWHKTIVHKLLASMVCFMFVFLWHGIQTYVLIWAVLNYVGIVCEGLFKSLYDQHLRAICAKHLSPAAERRWASLIASPLLALTAMSNFYFFAGVEIGNIFMRHFFIDAKLDSIFLIFLLYSCSEVSTFLKQHGKGCRKLPKMHSN